MSEIGSKLLKSVGVSERKVTLNLPETTQKASNPFTN
jgi:hypothetical protein